MESEGGEQATMKQPLPDIQSLGYDELLSERGRLQGLISSKEIELRQLEQMERRLIDSQGDPEQKENQVKDLTEIMGDFPSTVLRHLSALLTLDDVRGTHLFQRRSTVTPPTTPLPTFPPEAEVTPPEPEGGQEQPPNEERRMRLSARDTVGLDLLFGQLDDVVFNMMICGPKGVGKTTLFHTLFKLSESSEITGRAHISLTEALVSEGGHRLKVSCVQSDPKNANLLHSYLTDLHRDHFSSELSQLVAFGKKRVADRRIHCCLYLLPPHGCHGEKGLRELDINSMKMLAERVNLIPVIAKADTLTKSELAHYKKKVREAVSQHQIPVFQKSKYSEVGNSLPFAVASSYGKTAQFKREYPWGTFDVEDPALCDFADLRILLIRTHFRTLVEATHSQKYASFRLDLIKELELNAQNGGEVGSKKKAKKRSTIFRGAQ